MQRFVIHKVGIGSLGRLFGSWFAIIGLAVGIISALVSSIAIVNQNYSFWETLGLTAVAAIGWAVLYPLMMFFIGWLQGAILALIFNVVVASSGGLSIHTEETNMDGTPKLKASK